MFYDRIDFLCAERGMTVTELMRELGLSPSSASRWRNMGYSPSRAAAKKIADYFGITVAELMSGEIKKAPAKAEADDELMELLQDFKDNPELRALFLLSRKATPAELRQYAEVIKALRGSKEN